jgi:hypothetical protein
MVNFVAQLLGNIKLGSDGTLFHSFLGNKKGIGI